MNPLFSPASGAARYVSAVSDLGGTSDLDQQRAPRARQAWLGGSLTHLSRWIIPILCVVLFAVFPLLSLFAQNQPEVEVTLLWRYLAVCVAIAIVLFGLFFLITRNSAKSGVVASLVVFGFFYYGMFLEGRPPLFLALWLGLVLIGIVAVLRTNRDLASLTVVLIVVATVMVVPQAFDVARYQADHPYIAASDPRLWPTDLAAPVVSSGVELPDIYVISPDDYARTDILQQYFDYDEGAFVRQMEQRGFVFADDNRSPYSYSEMNMAALLNMDYLSNWPDLLPPESEDFNLVKRVSEDNRAARLLESIGYDYIHLDTDEVTFVGGNPGISPFATEDSFGNLWLTKSILGQVGGSFGFTEAASQERFRNTIRSEFDELRQVPSQDGPKFVVFHTLIPHDPFIFGPDGEDLTFPAGADHTTRVGMEYYVQQLQYVQRQILDTVDQILADSPTPPVILLQADEGFEVDSEVFGEEAAQDMRLKGVGAFYLPGLADPAVPDPPNTVNALRYVFNEYLGTDYPMLDSVSHLEGDLPFDFQEIPVR